MAPHADTLEAEICRRERISPSLRRPAARSIQAIRAGRPDRLIDLPYGVTWKGRTQAPAFMIAEGLHLDDLIKDTW